MGDSRNRSETYEAPSVADYGSLIELTATNGVTEQEDGIGKALNTDGSNGFVP